MRPWRNTASVRPSKTSSGLINRRPMAVGSGYGPPDTLRGRVFVQFVELCYYEYFVNKIRELKKELGSQESSGLLGSEELKQVKKLRSWIENTPLYLQLQWFDTVEELKVSSKLHSKRWNTEVTARNRLYLEHLGVDFG